MVMVNPYTYKWHGTAYQAYSRLLSADLEEAPVFPIPGTHALYAVLTNCVDAAHDLLLTSKKVAKVMRSHFYGQVQDSFFFFMRQLFLFAAVSCYVGRSRHCRWTVADRKLETEALSPWPRSNRTITASHSEIRSKSVSHPPSQAFR